MSDLCEPVGEREPEPAKASRSFDDSLTQASAPQSGCGLTALPTETLHMQRIAGNRATMRWLGRSGRLLQRELSWHQQRVEWIRAALKDENWDGADPPGAYYIFNGLSKDDMIRIYNSLAAPERKKLEDNLDKTNLDRARMYQGVQQAKAGGTWWREKSEAVHWAIRQSDFVSYPSGAYWIINSLNGADRAKIMTFLDRDHLDELVGHEEEAVTAGIPNARDIAAKARAARSGRGARDLEKRIAKLIPDSHPVPLGDGTRTVELPETNADVHEAFKALIALNDFDLLRTLRSLGPDKRLVLLLNIKQLDELGVDSSRIRRSLLRADQDRKDLTALSITTGEWDPYYKKPANDYSRTLRLQHPAASAPNIDAWQFDLGMDEIKDVEIPFEQAQQLWDPAKTRVGRGGLLWPAELNKSTVPNLWAIKEEARKRYSNQHAEDELFIITAFMAVEGLLHAGVGFSGGPGLVSTTRTTRGLRSGGGPFGTGGRLPQGEPLAYVNRNPRATPDEIRLGTFLDRQAQERRLPGVVRVVGAPEIKGARSGDYRFVLADGTELGADALQPTTGRADNVYSSIMNKTTQAPTVVVELGQGNSATITDAEALATATSAIADTHRLQRVIFVRNGAIIADVQR